MKLFIPDNPLAQNISFSPFRGKVGMGVGLVKCHASTPTLALPSVSPWSLQSSGNPAVTLARVHGGGNIGLAKPLTA